MAVAYSTRFLFGEQGPFNFTVPTGKRAVVKYIAASNANSVAGQTLLYRVPTLVVFLNVPANSAAQLTNQMIVIEAGEVLQVLSTVKQTAIVCGYLLDAV